MSHKICSRVAPSTIVLYCKKGTFFSGNEHMATSYGRLKDGKERVEIPKLGSEEVYTLDITELIQCCVNSRLSDPAWSTTHQVVTMGVIS